jgi:hypothetical protein
MRYLITLLAVLAALTLSGCNRTAPGMELDCVADQAGNPVSCVPDDDDGHSLSKTRHPVPVPAGVATPSGAPTVDKTFQRPATPKTSTRRPAS